MYRKNDFEVKSYGTGKEVRLPGPAPNRPNVYSFGTPYDQMYKELVEKDPKLYETNGVLVMLERNRQLKTAPERWHQETEEMFDVVITCEERCFDSVCEGMGVFFYLIFVLIVDLLADLLARGQKKNKIVHVINCNIRDNFQDAEVGGKWILDLATAVRLFNL
jgi:RNA polymerase II subunit A C-terminal domain phosphatase SSU72